MVRRTMISPLGFHEDRLLAGVTSGDVDHVVILHTDHPKARAAQQRAAKELKLRNVTSEDAEVPKAFNFVEWSRAVNDAAERHKRDHVVVNLTASHGVAVAMAAMIAAKRGLPAVVFDTEGTGLHHVAPAVLYHLDDLGETDLAVLRCLSDGERQVSEVQAATGAQLSTISISLKRLHEKGFLARRKEGRDVTYSLQPGVAEVHDSIL